VFGKEFKLGVQTLSYISGIQDLSWVIALLIMETGSGVVSKECHDIKIVQ
jgi:hypothetical protein